jgi:hypothetical protein
LSVSKERPETIQVVIEHIIYSFVMDVFIKFILSFLLIRSIALNYIEFTMTCCSNSTNMLLDRISLNVDSAIIELVASKFLTIFSFEITFIP